MLDAITDLAIWLQSYNGAIGLILFALIVMLAVFWLLLPLILLSMHAQLHRQNRLLLHIARALSDADEVHKE